jgi:hypothetical protein
LRPRRYVGRRRLLPASLSQEPEARPGLNSPGDPVVLPVLSTSPDRGFPRCAVRDETVTFGVSGGDR